MSPPTSFDVKRPFDYLNEMKNTIVSVTCIDKNIEGMLKAFDLHLNIILIKDNNEIFLQGSNIISIQPCKKGQKKLK